MLGINELSEIFIGSKIGSISIKGMRILNDERGREVQTHVIRLELITKEGVKREVELEGIQWQHIEKCDETSIVEKEECQNLEKTQEKIASHFSQETHILDASHYY